VLAFLSVPAIFATGGLNTASRLLSTLIAQHHPAIRRLFVKGPRSIRGKLEIEEPKSEKDCWHACIVEEEKTGADGGDRLWRWPSCHPLDPSKDLPLPVVPAIQEILGLGNVSLIVSIFSRLYNHEV
jgi:hypothetical protein